MKKTKILLLTFFGLVALALAVSGCVTRFESDSLTGTAIRAELEGSGGSATAILDLAITAFLQQSEILATQTAVIAEMEGTISAQAPTLAFIPTMQRTIEMYETAGFRLDHEPEMTLTAQLGGLARTVTAQAQEMDRAWGWVATATFGWATSAADYATLEALSTAVVGTYEGVVDSYQATLEALSPSPTVTATRTATPSATPTPTGGG